MGMDIASGGPAQAAAPVPVSAAPTTPAGSTGKAADTAATPATGDQVILSPQARALATLRSLDAAPAATGAAKATTADAQAEERFFEAVKTFFADRLGLDKNKILGRPDVNEQALRFLIRHTVLGALAPPSLLKTMGIDPMQPDRKGDGTLAEVKLNARDEGPALARVTFDPEALKELGRLPMKKKDRDRDGFFTVLDLMPGTREQETGKPIDNGKRFNDAEERYAREDAAARVQPGGRTRRIVMADGRNRPYLMVRLRDDLEQSVETPREAAANIGLGLVQFAGFGAN